MNAIQELVDGVRRGVHDQTLLGVTGSGKTITMANVIQQHGRPTLVLSHNKTLAAQLYGEFKELLPAQRRRVLHLVLRLLPARSVRPADRHLHREGRVDQRGHRPAAPARDVEPDGARGRHHRRHACRASTASAIPARVSRADGHARRRAQRIDRDEILRALVDDPVPAQRHRVRARQHSACAATRSRFFPPTRSRAFASRCWATRSSGSRRSIR